MEQNNYEVAINSANKIADALNFDDLQRAIIVNIFLRSVPCIQPKILSKTYVVIDHNTGFYKIGKSSNPIKREGTLQSEKPTVNLLFIINENVERELHKKFKDKRVRGEWFKLTNDDLNYILLSYASSIN